MAGQLLTTRSRSPAQGAPFMAQCLLLPPPPLQADQEGSLRRSQTPATLLEERTCLLTLSGPDPRSLVRLWGSGPSKTCCLTPGIGASPPALKCLHDWVSDLGQSSSFPPILGRWLKKEPGCVAAVPWWAGRARVRGTLLGVHLPPAHLERPLAGLPGGNPPSPRGERKSPSSAGIFTGTA